MPHFQYRGAYTDAESGLRYLDARYYDPSTQQFLSVGPLAPQTWERHAYAGDSATNFGDPSGLCGATQHTSPYFPPDSYGEWHNNKCQLYLRPVESHGGEFPY